jgi:hypothetical protein
VVHIDVDGANITIVLSMADIVKAMAEGNTQAVTQIEKQSGFTRDNVIDVLLQQGTTSAAKIAKALGFRVASAKHRNLLNEMVQDGELKRHGTGAMQRFSIASAR